MGSKKLMRSSKKPDLECLSEKQLQRLGDELDQQIAELVELRREVSRRLIDMVYWNYKREPWGHGWIQSSPRHRKKADGSTKSYRCWTFHWIEEGKEKVQRIGSDGRLQEWKKHYYTR